MPSFKDSNGEAWVVEIKTQSVQAIKNLCKDAAEKPIDLLAAIENGQLDQLIGNIELLVDMVFVLCIDQVKERFDVAKYDKDNEHMYELIPEWADEPTMTKASRWFGQRLNGGAVMELIEAFQEALIDFFPNEGRKKALRHIMEKNQELDRIQNEESVQLIDRAFEQAVPAIREEAQKHASKIQKFIRRGISSDSSGSAPESSE